MPGRDNWFIITQWNLGTTTLGTKKYGSNEFGYFKSDSETVARTE